MGLSARTSDFSGLPLGEGFITLSTSANNAILVKDPAEATAYMAANPAQFAQLDGASNSQQNTGGFNTEGQAPAQS